jgi:hypothetical protein
MDLIQKYILDKKIRLFLIFFYLLTFHSCNTEEKSIDISIDYKEDVAISATFFSKDDPADFHFYLKGNVKTAILGDMYSDGRMHSFNPVIPFTNGEEYELQYRNKVICEFSIIDKNKSVLPEMTKVYPTTEKVPENLLKMYFVFSNPMQEVHKSLDYIKVVKLSDNKEVDIFLELEPELWNKEHTQLTLWLDPGRIKTGLIPNKKMGLPILAGNRYVVKVDKSWEDADGNQLKQDYFKTLDVGLRDKERPSEKNWEIIIPRCGTKGPLAIDFKEPLDAMLSGESFDIYKFENNLMDGKFKLKNNEEVLLFYPDSLWTRGAYKILVASRLEDLAGNNLNQLFDEDLELTSATDQFSPIRTISFFIN